ncbi:MAG: hypothetical protein KC420_17920 [Myxococcales bacterium]|nr:hypothetical protein [Myxococcales bacterium]
MMAGGRRARVKTSGPTAAAADGLGTDKLYFKIGEVAAIVGVEKVGMFTWVRVRLANGKEERRFFKPAIDRVEPS